MKVLYFLSLLLPCVAMAQNNPSERWFTFNPELGINLAAYTNSGNYKMNAGLLAGFHVRLGKRLYLQPGLQVVEHKLQASLDSSYVPGAQQIQAYYLNVPVVAGFNLVHRDLFMLRVYGGVVRSVFLGADIQNARNIKEDDFNRGINSARVGLGMDVWRITWSASFDYGFTDVISSKDFRSLAVTTALGFKFF